MALLPGKEEWERWPWHTPIKYLYIIRSLENIKEESQFLHVTQQLHNEIRAQSMFWSRKPILVNAKSEGASLPFLISSLLTVRMFCLAQFPQWQLSLETKHYHLYYLKYRGHRSIYLCDSKSWIWCMFYWPKLHGKGHQEEIEDPYQKASWM